MPTPSIVLLCAVISAGLEKRLFSETLPTLGSKIPPAALLTADEDDFEETDAEEALEPGTDTTAWEDTAVGAEYAARETVCLDGAAWDTGARDGADDGFG